MRGYPLSIQVPGHLVLVPFLNAVSVSKRITSGKERKRLLRLIQSIKPENILVNLPSHCSEGKANCRARQRFMKPSKTWDGMVWTIGGCQPRDKVIGGWSKPLRCCAMREQIVRQHPHWWQRFTRKSKHQLWPSNAPKGKIVKFYTGKARFSSTTVAEETNSSRLSAGKRLVAWRWILNHWLKPTWLA